ncbi:hypothetical protein GGF46_000062 [Coemansia sp. RSA 552]|nr:hypothetical protein GGF46_000062 [Coemansia sp. RSA 552]
MLSRSLLTRPHFTALFRRHASSGGQFEPPQAKPAQRLSTAESIKQYREEQMQKALSSSATDKQALTNQNMLNAQYTKKLFPKTTYHPGELNEGNARKTYPFSHVNRNMSKDPFVVLEMNPLKEYKNSMLLSSFVTDMGRIKPRHLTGLSAKSQRRLAKAIRRARSFGLIPVTDKFNYQVNRVSGRRI